MRVRGERGGEVRIQLLRETRPLHSDALLSSYHFVLSKLK